MNFKTNLPEIATLRSRVKEKSGLALDTHFHFIQLVAKLEKELREHMSETTLERVWGYSTRGYDTVSRRTLDVLSRFVGAKNWDDFAISYAKRLGVNQICSRPKPLHRNHSKKALDYSLDGNPIGSAKFVI